MARFRIVAMTDRPSISITDVEWPVIASARWHDTPLPSQANCRHTMFVREHEDGRRLVYGVAEGFWPGAIKMRAGYLTDVAGTVEAIHRVAEAIGAADHLADECIAGLPTEVL